MKTTSSTAKRHAADIGFFLMQAKLAAEIAEYGAPSLSARLKAQKLRDGVGRLRQLAHELTEEMA